VLVLGIILPYVPGNDIPTLFNVIVADNPRPTKEALVSCIVVTVPSAEVKDWPVRVTIVTGEEVTVPKVVEALIPVKAVTGSEDMVNDPTLVWRAVNAVKPITLSGIIVPTAVVADSPTKPTEWSSVVSSPSVEVALKPDNVNVASVVMDDKEFNVVVAVKPVKPTTSSGASSPTFVVKLKPFKVNSVPSTSPQLFSP